MEVEKNGEVVYSGTYQNVYNINQGVLRIKPVNQSKPKPIRIAKSAVVKKYDVFINGCLKGIIHEGKEGYLCFAHCLSKKESD